MSNSSILSLWSKEKTASPPERLPLGSPYTMQLLEEICKNHGIDQDLLIPLSEQLDYACHLYNIRVGNRLGKLTNKEVKRRLAKLEKRAGKLKKDLQNLHPQVSRECITTYKELSEEAMTLDDNARLTKIDAKDKIKRFEDIFVFPAIIELVCNVANKQVVPASAGRNADDALYVWVKIVSQFWINTLKRSYTLDTNKGEPITAAGRFLADCMMPLDRRAISGIYTQMRRFIEEERPVCRN